MIGNDDTLRVYHPWGKWRDNIPTLSTSSFPSPHTKEGEGERKEEEKEKKEVEGDYEMKKEELNRKKKEGSVLEQQRSYRAYRYIKHSKDRRNDKK